MQCDHQEATAWTIIGVALRNVLDVVLPWRLAVARMPEYESRGAKAHILWAVLQMHLHFDAVLAAGFKGHGCVTAAMSNFLLKHRVDRSQFQTLTSQVKDANNASKAAQTKGASLEESVKTIKTTLQSHTTKISTLEKRVNERPGGLLLVCPVAELVLELPVPTLVRCLFPQVKNVVAVLVLLLVPPSLPPLVPLMLVNAPSFGV